MVMGEQSNKPCRVLIVEDTEERQKILTDLYRAHAWILVNTGRRAMTLLSVFEFDIISLDYNLRGDFTGADIAQYIAESYHQQVRIIIHSMNPQGATRIAALLPNAIQFPVYKMVRSNTIFKTLRTQLDALGSSFDWIL
jgi:CheY-like chemotaxis protein